MIVDLVERTQQKNKTVVIVTGNEKIKATLHKLSLDTLLLQNPQQKAPQQLQFENRALAIESINDIKSTSE
jgi:anti-anti-sigma regulatory factor